MLARSLTAMFFSAMLCAAAAADPVLDRCQSDNPKIAIPACSALIKAGDPDREFVGTLHGLRGMAYYHDGQYKKAIPDISSSIAASKDENYRADAVRFRAQAYFFLKDYPNAIAGYTEVIRLRPADHRSYNDRAYQYMKTKNYSAAIADYTAALDRKPDIAQALYGRGLAKRASGDSAGAEADIAKARGVQSDIGDSFADLEAAIH